MKTNEDDMIKISKGVCCKYPSCTTRIKNNICNHCGKSCKGCKFE